MAYSIRTTEAQSGVGYRHEFLRDGKPTPYAEFNRKREPPKRMRLWLAKLNEVRALKEKR